MMLDSREINDIECRALAMLKDHSLLNPARNSRKSNKSKPCRRDQHDTRTEKLPDRSSNLKDDRNSSDDGPYGLVPDTAAKNMDVAQTASPGHAIRPNRRSTRLSALQPCQEKVKKRKREAHKQEKRKSRRSMTVSTEYKARQDLDEGDADGTKLKKEYKRGELLIHGEDTYKKIKLDLKAINGFLNNTKQCEPAPPRSDSSVNTPIEQYLTPMSDEETQASYQAWINQLKAKKKQRQLGMLHDKMCLQKDFLPGLTFEQFWARMKHHSRNPRILEHLYGQQNQMDHIRHECHITDKRNRIRQKQYMVQWADTYILKRHLPMYLEQGYKVIGVDTCPILRRCAGRTARHKVVKATWEPIREPAQNVPKEVMEDFEAKKAGLKPLKLARDNRAKPDQAKSNIDKQGYQMPVQDKEVSAFLHEPSLARFINIEPTDTVNPDQDIKPMFKYVISMSWRGQRVRETVANVYNPSDKLCGSITMHRLCILYSAFRHSQLHQPETHKRYGHLDFPTAIARLLNRYTNKPTDGSKRSKLANQCTTPDKYMQALKDGLSVTTERFASPLNFNPNMTCYFSMYAEDALFGANF